MTWDEYFIRIARTVSIRSKDPSTKVGSVIVGPEHEIRSTGYNSFPRGINDYAPERLERPEKYLWMSHAEENAIYNAARAGVRTEGCILYCTLIPCMGCTKAIVQAGLAEVVVDKETQTNYCASKSWDEQWLKARTLLHEARVHFRLYGGVN